MQRAWLTRSARWHPDRSPDDPEAAQRLARINKAMSVLEHPEKRANAFLEHLGGPAKDQEKTLPEGFLMEMFELREEHELGDEATRTRLEQWGMQRQREHIDAVARMFEALSEPPSSEALTAIRVELNAWRYIERFLTEPGLD